MYWKRHLKISSFLLICLFVLLFIDVQLGYSNVFAENEEIDASQEPVQDNNIAAEPFTFKVDEASFKVTPLARYYVAARIVGIREYFSGWNSLISPMDLALAWGGLAEPDYNRYIKYEQHDRWYFYRFNQNSPFDKQYITRHSANTHIIPATENILNGLYKLEVDQLVILNGYLVRVDLKYNGESYWWQSSLSREDSGDGSCEVMYVTQIATNGTVYE